MPSNRIVYTTRQKSARSTGRPRWSWLFLFSLPVIAIACIYFIRIPALQVSAIIISGTETIPEQDIKTEIQKSLTGTYAFLIPRAFTLATDTNALTQQLRMAFPRLSAVSIARELPHTLRVTITERKPWGIICGTSGCAYLDQTGFAYEESPDFSGTLFPKITTDSDITVPQQDIEPVLMNQILTLNSGIAKIINVPNVHYELSSKTAGEIHIIMPEGFTLYVNRDDDFQNVFRVLKTVLTDEIKNKRSQLDYIDLRFGNKVFYKMK